MSRVAKGKKRALRETPEEDTAHVASTSTTPAQSVPIKKPKRAVTRKCPVCDEDIPVRLLDVHAELEAERVEEIIKSIGSSEVLEQAEPDDGLTARTRRSALKARKSMGISQPYASSSKLVLMSSETSLEVVDKTLKTIKRRRKQRNAKLREMTKEEEDITGLSGYRGGRGRWAGRGDGEGTVCPVCIKVIAGDPDVVEAHVDACLAHQAALQDAREREERERRAREEQEADAWEEIDVDGDVRISVTDGATFRGTGFDTRDRTLQDVDDDIDIDGEDDVLYGAAQFTEGDIVMAPNASGPSSHSHSSDNNDEEEEEKGLQDLVAQGKLIVKQDGAVLGTMEEIATVDEVVEQARKSGDALALISALQSRVKILEASQTQSSSPPLLCRICIDPYSEPTVSTGCWHTCCRECWLRCLGSTKLCPICKRITSAGELRRVYL